MLLSVILPFFNAEKTLERAVKSVLAQSFFDFELLLVDNNSTDKSLEIAVESSFTDKRIRILSEERQGVSYAANCGILAAKGEFIARMDADDEMLPDRLEKQIYFLRKNPDIDVVSAQVRHAGNAESEGLRIYTEWTNTLITDQDIKRNRFRELPVINPTLMFRKTVFETHGLFSHDAFPEDYGYFLKLCQADIHFYKLPEILHVWHDSPDRLTRTHARYTPEAFMAVKAKYLAKFIQSNLLEKRKIYIWGAGKRARLASRFLEAENIRIDGFIDVDKRKAQQSGVLFYTDIPEHNKPFIISFVANRGAGTEIRTFLESRFYGEMTDFIISA